MSSAMQSRLLRVLQEGEIRPVGSQRACASTSASIAASNRDVKKLVVYGRFREYLYIGCACYRSPCPPCAIGAKISRSSSRTFWRSTRRRDGIRS